VKSYVSIVNVSVHAPEIYAPTTLLQQQPLECEKVLFLFSPPMIAALLYALSARPLLCVVIRNINFISGHRRLQSGEEREILFLHFALLSDCRLANICSQRRISSFLKAPFQPIKM
jgi:hypothetical protein